MDIIIGKIFKKRYQIIKKIAIGGTSEIYLGKDLKLDRKIILKIFSFQVFERPECRQFFFNEIINTSKLQNKNIVKIYDFFIFEDYLCIILEYIEGKNLRDYFSKNKIFSEAEIINIFMKILEPLINMEEKKIIHRDLKPENIIINSRKNIKILDFGISIDLNLRSPKYKFALIGSVKYLAPEVLAKYRITNQSDIYSFGIMLFEAHIGDVPLNSSSIILLMKMHLYDDIPRVRSLNSQISQAMENIIVKATAKNLNERYKNFAEIKEDFLNALKKKKENPLILENKVYLGSIKNELLLVDKKENKVKVKTLKKILFSFFLFNFTAFIFFAVLLLFVFP